MNRAFKRFAGTGIAFAALLATSIAAGGYVWAPGVDVYKGSTGGSVYGSIAGARYSSDSNQDIGCETIASGGSPYAYCWGEDAANNYASCSTTDPNMVATIGQLTDMSILYATFNSGGTCTAIYLQNLAGSLH